MGVAVPLETGRLGLLCNGAHLMGRGLRCRDEKLSRMGRHDYGNAKPSGSALNAWGLPWGQCPSGTFQDPVRALRISMNPA